MTPLHVTIATATAILSIVANPAVAQNQSDSLSPLVTGGVPFRVEMELVDWVGDDLPAIHSAAYATLGEQLLLVGGKTSGLHNFTCDPDVNWPAADFNGTLMVVDFKTRDTFTRPLADVASGLAPNQIASLSSSNPLSHQSGERLVSLGGYGIDEHGDYVTFSTLRVLDVAGVIGWVRGDRTQLADHIHFHESPENAPPDFFTICGGVLIENGDEFWSCLGQNFQGGYVDLSACPSIGTTQAYTKSIRRFALDAFRPDAPPVYLGETASPPAWARRRDLNVLPAVVPGGDGAVALAGVFTLEEGIWTAPIVIDPQGEMSMGDHDAPGTLLQGFNAYESGRLSLWSELRRENWFLTFGGLGFQVLAEGTLVENYAIPYSNETLAVRYAPDTDSWSQHLIGTSYPLSTDENGNAWFNGTDTLTIPLVDQSRRQIDLDAITEPTSVAYLYGGIVANGQGIVTFPDTFASNQLFEVILVPGPGCSADLDGDGTVDSADLATLLLAWGRVPPGTPADLNADGVVSSADLGWMFGAWGVCPGP
jgi:hypothetical protein